MPFYHKLGSIPRKRHTQFRKPDGSLYKEELMGTRGFSGIQTILYHLHEPTRIKKIGPVMRNEPKAASDLPLCHRLLETAGLNTSGDPIDSRECLLFNANVAISLATPTVYEMKYFYRNGGADELIFIERGTGRLSSQFGELDFRAGDYIVIPVGTTYRLTLDAEDARLLVVESSGRIEVPRRYRNEYGQLNEHSPFCERDIKIPVALQTIDESGEFEVKVKVGSIVTTYIMGHHPFDVIGWDGYLYPWIFNISDFEPITGRIHQPPPVHQTFSAEGFVVCSFVPRMYDYHPDAIPVPYNHSNVNSDEVLFYVGGEFMSRKGVVKGSMTHHPAGIPHGPHPGSVEKSLGKTRTEELAVMIDTFLPLKFTKKALELSNNSYSLSWYDQ
jgi:homogentisate 1,2-dioxygenase